MVHVWKEYYIGSDGTRNYILFKKSIIGSGKKGQSRTNKKNIGKESFYPIGYYSSFGSVFRTIIEKFGIDEASLPVECNIKEFFECQNEFYKFISSRAREILESLSNGNSTIEIEPETNVE